MDSEHPNVLLCNSVPNETWVHFGHEQVKKELKKLQIKKKAEEKEKLKVKEKVTKKTKEIVNKVINCPKIAIHLIFIRFANKTVFTY